MIGRVILIQSFAGAEILWLRFKSRRFMCLQLCFLLFSVTAFSCISDLSIQQKSMPAFLTPLQLKTLFTLASQNQPQKGWNLLGQWGDPYAQLASQVLNPNAQLPASVYHRLIINHWRNVVGEQNRMKTFSEVALQHYSQYISIIQQTSNWPDSDQILMSYLQAARDHGLPDLIVFDATWDAAGYNVLRSWQSLNHLEKKRTIEPTNVCFAIEATEARQILFRDFNLTEFIF